jgi:hypothetical protein
MVMYHHQKAGQTHNTKLDNESFKELGMMINQNYMHEEIKSRLNLGNPFQNLLSSSLLFKNIKIEICKTVLLPVVSYGC